MIFMAVVMEGYTNAVIRVNARSSDDRSAKVAADILNDLTGIALIGHSSDIEPIVVVCIDVGFYILKESPSRLCNSLRRAV